MSQIVIPIYFDYASTLCYVAWRIVGQLEPELGFTALWKGVPIALRNYRTRPGLPLGPLELGANHGARSAVRGRGSDHCLLGSGPLATALPQLAEPQSPACWNSSPRALSPVRPSPRPGPGAPG